jgi:formylglycine-generating enzyme required for sulfatase activity
MVLALICVSAIGCGDDDPVKTEPEPETTGTVVVDRSPNTVTCTWQLTGPDTYLHNGTGDETLTDLEPGDYTLTWTAVSGWNSPSPVSETKTLTAGHTTTFTGTYVLQAGSITVNPEPNTIDAPWTLTGPSSYSHSGTGDETIPGLTPGSYTITWEAVTGWDLPSPASESLALTDGGTVTFNGTYTEESASTGTVRVQPQNAADAPWHLDGPASYSHDGTGYEELLDMAVGEYTVTWGAVTGYTTPASASQTLTEGVIVTFQGAYGAQTSDLWVVANPDAINAPWHLDGPGGYTYDGNGTVQMSGRIWGEYTITWGAVSGWNLPDPASEIMTLDGTPNQTFTGNYTQEWTPEMVLIAGGKFEMGSPVTEPGRNVNETRHWVQVSSFHMCVTEITNSQYQSVVPDHTYSEGSENRAVFNKSRMAWFEFCNALSSAEGLSPCYTIVGTDPHGAEVTCDWNANGYRMPTEAEWEYACRAGSTTAFANGEITNELCDDPVLDLIARYCGNDPHPTYEVRTKIPNDWGLYDMHGNAGEHVWDRYGDYGTGTFESPDIDPTGPATGTTYVYRTYPSGYARHHRSAVRPWTSGPYFGMRLVRKTD